MSARERTRRGHSLIETLVVMAIIGILIALILPAERSRARRESAMRRLRVRPTISSKSGSASHHFYEAQNRLPTAATYYYDASHHPHPLLSWRVILLPYLEQKILFDQFAPTQAWDSPPNQPLVLRMPSLYACPDDPGPTSQGATPLSGDPRPEYRFRRGAAH